MSDMPLALNAADAARLEAYLHKHIPLVRHMQVRVTACDASGLTLTAPLAANINHKASAFGGSLASLATLACWGLMWLVLKPAHGTHIVVNESRMLYLRPVTAALVAHCPLPDAPVLNRFLRTFERRQKARIHLHAQVLQDQRLCARFNGYFVAYHAKV
ncbi:MAG: YiiD C-terminal domain-containing protein [Gammaproteobacteria bacterium]